MWVVAGTETTGEGSVIGTRVKLWIVAGRGNDEDSEACFLFFVSIVVVISRWAVIGKVGNFYALSCKICTAVL